MGRGKETWGKGMMRRGVEFSLWISCSLILAVGFSFSGRGNGNKGACCCFLPLLDHRLTWQNRTCEKKALLLLLMTHCASRPVWEFVFFFYHHTETNNALPNAVLRERGRERKKSFEENPRPKLERERKKRAKQLWSGRSRTHRWYTEQQRAYAEAARGMLLPPPPLSSSLAMARRPRRLYATCCRSAGTAEILLSGVGGRPSASSGACR